TLLFFFFYCYAAHRDLPSFPTRRSSDLPLARRRLFATLRTRAFLLEAAALSAVALLFAAIAFAVSTRVVVKSAEQVTLEDLNGRSEEHTSELQSRGHLVCRLLLEKKKKD